MKRLHDTAIVDEGQREEMHDGCEQCRGSAYFEGQHRTGGELNAIDLGQVGVQDEADGDQQAGQRVGGGQVQAEQKHRRFVVDLEVTDREQGGIQENAHQAADHEQRTNVDIERLGYVVWLTGVLENLLDRMLVTVVHDERPAGFDSSNRRWAKRRGDLEWCPAAPKGDWR